jgi:hypothetical protein
MKKILIIATLLTGCYKQTPPTNICEAPPVKHETGKWIFNNKADAYFWVENAE